MTPRSPGSPGSDPRALACVNTTLQYECDPRSCPVASALKARGLPADCGNQRLQRAQLGANQPGVYI
jgi:hypothetical protein